MGTVLYIERFSYLHENMGNQQNLPFMFNTFQKNSWSTSLPTMNLQRTQRLSTTPIWWLKLETGLSSYLINEYTPSWQYYRWLMVNQWTFFPGITTGHWQHRWYSVCRLSRRTCQRYLLGLMCELFDLMLYLHIMSVDTWNLNLTGRLQRRPGLKRKCPKSLDAGGSGERAAWSR